MRGSTTSRSTARNRRSGCAPGAFFGGRGSLALMGASGLMTCIYAITKINYTYMVPMTIFITMRGRLGDRAKFHVSNGLYLEPVMQSIDPPLHGDRTARRAGRDRPRGGPFADHLAPRRGRLHARPALRGERLMAMADGGLLRPPGRALDRSGGRHLGRQRVRDVVEAHRRDREGVLPRSLDEPCLAVRRRHRLRHPHGQCLGVLGRRGVPDEPGDAHGRAPAGASQPDPLPGRQRGLRRHLRGRTWRTQGETDYAALARACGLRNVFRFGTLAELRDGMDEVERVNGEAFVVLEVEPLGGALPDPPMDGPECKFRFGRYLERTYGVRIFDARV